MSPLCWQNTLTHFCDFGVWARLGPGRIAQLLVDAGVPGGAPYTVFTWVDILAKTAVLTALGAVI